jgi:hypothetical protein
MIIPCQIRSHLVPFLFEQFEGKQASYQGTTVSSIRFLPSSSIAKFLYELMDYKKKRGKQDHFVMYLTIERKKNLNYSGMIYTDNHGVKEKLLLPEEKVKAFNSLLEDIFRIALVFHVKGCVKSGMSVMNSLEAFASEYDLEENGIEVENLRQLYYREKKTNLFSRLQFQSSNRVVNYC